MWKHISSDADLDQIISSKSYLKPVILFKHSTRCPVSFTAKKSFEFGWKNELDCEVYLLDLISYRTISSKIEQLLGVQHESPQLIVVSKGKSIFNASHGMIDADEVMNVIQGK